MRNKIQNYMQNRTSRTRVGEKLKTQETQLKIAEEYFKEKRK